MRYRDIIEATNAMNMEVYHWTSAENLIRILNSDTLDIGASTHTLNGKTLSGVSVTRDAYLDLANTYAVSGRKAWRIGLNYRRLRHNFRVMPIRDDYLRSVPRGKTKTMKQSLGLFGPTETSRVSSDEMEEFVLSPITPLGWFITSIGVEDRYVDPTAHPGEVASDPDYFEDEFDLHSIDQQLVFSLLSESDPDFIHATLGQYKKFRNWRPLYVDNPGVPLQIIHRDPHRTIPIEKAWAWAIPQPQQDDETVGTD